LQRFSRTHAPFASYAKVFIYFIPTDFSDIFFSLRKSAVEKPIIDFKKQILP
jgi:hypothetical protein